MSIPIITSLSPNIASLNTITNVTINGSNLANLSSVQFGTITPTIISTSPTQIAVELSGQSTAQSVDVIITTILGSNTPNINSLFTFGDPTPAVVSISPSYIAQSASNTNIVFAGSNFTANSVVKNYTKGFLGDFSFIVVSTTTGQYQSTTDKLSGTIIVSSDYGVTWALADGTSSNQWRVLTMSDSGERQASFYDNSRIFMSNNYGSSWSPIDNLLPKAWRSMSMSSSGQYITAVSYYNLPSYGHIYRTEDYGATWSLASTAINNKNWVYISMSKDGRYQNAVSDNSMYVSSNYGQNWTNTTKNDNYKMVTMSNSGQYQTAVSSINNRIYTSANYGVTWQIFTVPLASWNCVSMSALGQYQTVLGTNASSGVIIYKSSNSGDTWTPVSATLESDSFLNNITVSGTGAYQTITTKSKLYKSSDYGDTWTEVQVNIEPGIKKNVAMSYDGRYQTTVSSAYNGRIYISSNYGQNWTTPTATITKTFTPNSFSSENLAIDYTLVQPFDYPPYFKVYNNDNESNEIDYYIVSNPSINSTIFPTEGPPGMLITLTSPDLYSLEGDITIVFNTTNIQKTLEWVIDRTTTTFNVPQLNYGTYNVYFTNVNGNLSKSNTMTFTVANVDAKFKNCNFTVSNSNTFFDLSYYSSLVLTDNEFVATNSDANFTFVPAQSTSICSLKYYNNSYSTSNPDADVSVVIPSSGETGWNNINQLATEPIGITGSTGSIIIGGNGNKTGYNDTLQVLNDGSTDYIKVSGSIVPSAGNVFSLGSTGAAFSEIYMGPGTINIAGSSGITGGTIGANSAGLVYTESGFATPFINIGPTKLTPGALGGWNVTAAGTAETSNYNLIAQENTVSGSLTGPAYSMLISPQDVIWVAKNGSETGNGRFNAPFNTITQGLAKASGTSGATVWVMPGTYEESITIPTNIVVRGQNLQSCIVSQLNVVVDTTVVTMGTNSRFEDMTVNVTSSNNSNITGVLFPNGTAKTAKIRTVVVNATNSSGGSANVCCGVKCTDSTTNNVVSSFNAIQRMTINATTNCVTGSSAYAILNSSNAYFSVRDSTLFATGTNGAQCIGVLSSGASGYTSIKTSTCSGSTYDIDRTGGDNCTLLLSATDLQNASSNGNGFSVNIQPSFMSFGLFGNIGTSSVYNLAPGTIAVGSEPSLPYPIYFPSSTIIFQATCFVSPEFTTVGEQIIIRFYKNATVTPFLTMTLSSTVQKVISTGFSTTISSSDYITATATCSGVGNGHNISCTISLY